MITIEYFKLTIKYNKKLIIINILCILILYVLRVEKYVFYILYCLVFFTTLFYYGFFKIKTIKIINNSKIFVNEYILPRRMAIMELRIDGVNGVYSKIDIEKNSKNLLVYKFCKKILDGFLDEEYIQLKNALVLGCGGGTVPKYVANNFDNVQIDIVELYFDIIEIAKKYFIKDELENINIYKSDAFLFVEKLEDTKKYDFIFIDVFIEDKLDNNSLESNFIKKIERIMSLTGVVIHNLGNINSLNFDINFIINLYKNYFNSLYICIENNSFSIVAYNVEKKLANMDNFIKLIKIK